MLLLCVFCCCVCLYVCCVYLRQKTARTHTTRTLTKHTNQQNTPKNSNKDIRETSVKVACAVIKTAALQGHVGSAAAHDALSRGDASLAHWIRTQMFTPRAYAPLAFRPPGIGE